MGEASARVHRGAPRDAMGTAALLALLFACGSGSSTPSDSGPRPTDASQDASPDAQTDECPAGAAGASCVLGLYDDAVGGCDPVKVKRFRKVLDARDGFGPLWADGRALFRTIAPSQVAGDFNGWSASALATKAFCQTDLVIGVGNVASGFHPYKLVTAGTWSLDARNPAFAYDDFVDNPDSRNSVLNTPDSGRGHLVKLDNVCSTALGNCRDVTAYLPPGYYAPVNAARTYPVLFMHDGQNVWDDHECCFGNGGWEVNVTLDAEIAAGRVAPVIVIAADTTANRSEEYAFSEQAAFIAFQLAELQPRELAKVRGNGELFIAGSSFGGLVSMELALHDPPIYTGVATLSGAYWPSDETHTALADRLPTIGKKPLAIYFDHGGAPQGNADNYSTNIQVRDLLLGMGWHNSCTTGPNSLCYYWEPNALHNEAAWKLRVYRFLRFLFPA